jgi:hypothetical protein
MALFSDTIRKLIEQKTNRLESIPDAFAADMIRIQQSKFNDIIGLLNELEFSGGSLVTNKTNLTKIEGVVDSIKDVLTDDEFEDAVSGLLKEFDTQADINYKYFGEVVEDFKVPAIADDILNERKVAAVESLLNSTDDLLTNPMRQELANSVTSGATRKDLINTFRTLVLGSNDTDGRLLRSTRQIVSDTFALSDASVSNAVADQLGLDYYLFTGGLIETTRCFCRERNGKYFHRKEVEAWGRKEKLGKCKTNKGWAGMMAGTNEKTIFITRGGYNCQHALLAVSEAVVPKEVISRNA